MGLPPNILKPIDAPLYDFSSLSGGVKLLVIAGSHPDQATVLTNFLVVDTLGIYNSIISKPTLNALKVVVSTYHLALKFPMLVGVGVV